MKNQKAALFLTMLKIGAFTFGGGYAMIALLENELVTKKQFLTSEELLDVTAAAESTPGPVAINAATFVGWKVGRFWGSVLATLGVTLPSVIVLSLIAHFYDAFMALPYVAGAFAGIRVCVVLLILRAGWKLTKSLPKTTFNKAVWSVVLLLVVGLPLFGYGTYTILFVAVSGFLSVLRAYLPMRKGDKR